MEQSLSIVFFTSYAHTQGTYFRWHNLALALASQGHKVQIFATDNALDSASRSETRDGIEYHIVPGTKGQSYLGTVSHPITALKRAFISYPEADVYHFFQPFPSAALPAYLHKKKAKLLVYDWDDLWYGGWIKGGPKYLLDYYFNPLTQWLERKLPKFIGNVTVCSAYLQQMAEKRGATNVKVIHNGFWKSDQVTSKQEARLRFKFREDCFYFGFMGRTIEEIEWCFDVLLETQDQAHRYRLALCGMDKSLLESFDSKLLERVDYFGQLKPEETRYFSRAIDCGLLPLEDNPFNNSRFPIKFAEYLAMETPALCSDIGEIARLGKSLPGVIPAGENREGWKRAIRNVVQREQQGVLPKVDLDALNQRLTWHKIGENLVGFYKESIQPKGL